MTILNINHPAADDAPQISIIIPTKNGVSLLKQCIKGLLDTSTYPVSLLEIIVINNQSSDNETLRYLDELLTLNFIKVIDYSAPFNFSSINNLAVKHAKYDILCLLNNDIEVITPNWLGEMAYFIKSEDIGCVGAKLYYPNDTIQHAGVVLGINEVAGHIYKHCPRNASGHNNHLLHARHYSAVTAACMLVRKSSYLEAGGFDENLAVAYNDVDFCLKLRELGYKHVWTPRAELYHHESVSRGTHKQRTWSQRRQFKKEVAYMKKKWGDKLQNDPAWNPNWPLNESWDGQFVTKEKPAHIILTTYNGVEYVAKQLDSLLAQSCPCLIHIYDDGSSDGTIELIQSHYTQHDNIHLTLNETRLGHVRNIEQGIKKSYDMGAQFLALCDQDDIWHPQRIEKMATALLTSKPGTPTLAYSDLQMIDSNEYILDSSYLSFRQYSSRRKESPSSLAVALGQNGVMGNTVLMNRALVEQALPFPENLHSHDYWISLVAQLYGRCILIPEPLVNYRIHSNNSSNSVKTLAGSSQKNLRRAWQRIKKRDYRLPYKEDTRNQIMRHLLDQNHHPISLADGSTCKTSGQERALMLGFLHYLNFDKPRLYLAYWMIKHNFIKKGLRHKLRFIYRMLVTTRYQPHSRKNDIG